MGLGASIIALPPKLQYLVPQIPPFSNMSSPESTIQPPMTQEFLILLSTVPFTLTYLLTSIIPVYLEVCCIGALSPPLSLFSPPRHQSHHFGTCPYIASTQCPHADIVLRVSCRRGIMKSLDIWRRHHVSCAQIPGGTSGICVVPPHGTSV